MARMLSALKKAGKEDKLAEYKALTSNGARHEFYYNCWLAENPKQRVHNAVRSRASERVDTASSKDHGWVSRDYVAAMLQLQNWRTVPDQKILLELELAKLPSKLHDQASVFPEGMDKQVYHYVQTLSSTDEHNTKKFEYQEQNELDAKQGEAMLAAIERNHASSAIAGTTSRRNRPSPSPPGSGKPPKPQWLTDFEKNAVNFFKATKRSVELASKQASELVRQAEEHKSKLDQLAQAYLDTVTSQLVALDKADRVGTEFQLAADSKPENEAAAEDLTKTWKEAAHQLKAAKTAFLTATTSMQTSLRATLAPILKAAA